MMCYITLFLYFILYYDQLIRLYNSKIQQYIYSYVANILWLYT